MSILSEWNVQQKKLNTLIKKEQTYAQAKELLLSLHQSAHFSIGKTGSEKTIMDDLWDGLLPYEITIMPTKKDVTIAWDLWHITRIEDLTVNILIRNESQVLNGEWIEKLNADVTDTGNAMSDDEIISFSKKINMDQLKNYRIEVGKRTRGLLEALEFRETLQPIEKQRVKRILAEGGVTEHPDSIWLLDFWSKKNVAGLLLMPVTRHQSMHLNDADKLKQAIRKRKSFYRD